MAGRCNLQAQLQGIARVTRSRPWLVLLALALAFGFLGSRGLYDPDEGRYTNVALTMLESGDWINPQRNEDTGHWTKPPLTYWAIAASLGTFGKNPWAARVPSALAFLLCAWLCWRSARRLAPGAEDVAALAYMTLLMPSVAAQLVTTDFLLSAFQALALYAFVEWRFVEGGPARRWLVLMWVAFALAFLTKGPPALLPLLVLTVFTPLAPSTRPQGWVHVIWGVLLFAAVASPWFIEVTSGHPGLMGYFLGREVVDRVATDHFARHGEWYGWAEVYLPTLLVGTLPWTLRLLRWARGLGAAARRWRDRALRAAEAPDLLLALWVLVPLAIFCLARSRLPLYLLPLFVPFALIIARQVSQGVAARPSWRWVLAWAALLLALRLGSSFLHDDKDASAWAREIRQRVEGPLTEVVFVEDMPRYGLHLYLDVEVETLSLDEPGAFSYDPEYDESLAVELAELPLEHGVVFVTKRKAWAEVERRVRAAGSVPVVRGDDFHHRVIFTVVAPAAAP
jgi:4-amino-4-deoxy-L-arabinose transferase-like glycosyltransferase